MFYDRGRRGRHLGSYPLSQRLRVSRLDVDHPRASEPRIIMGEHLHITASCMPLR